MVTFQFYPKVHGVVPAYPEDQCGSSFTLRYTVWFQRTPRISVVTFQFYPKVHGVVPAYPEDQCGSSFTLRYTVWFQLTRRVNMSYTGYMNR